MESKTNPAGWWIPPADVAPDRANRVDSMRHVLYRVGKPLFVAVSEGETVVACDGTALMGRGDRPSESALPLKAWIPPLNPADLGDPVFRRRYGLRFPYVAGAMANGITSVEMVRSMGEAGMIGFFGAAGLSLDRIESAIDDLKAKLGDRPYGCNLIHSPYDPALEEATVDLYLRRGIRRVSASAYLDLTPSLVRYRLSGIHRDPKGRVVCPNQVLAKVSRVEVARKFLSPAPAKWIAHLLDRGLLAAEQAALAEGVPMADDMTAEADSGGHTDNRPALALLPVMTRLRDEMTDRYQYGEPVCVGLAGGIATPESTAAAFAMGAAYVLTGSINQSCVEAGTSDAVRRMLAEAEQADVVMAPAADMFEMGVKVQVLKRGTLFAVRAAKLYDLYRRYDSWEAVPASERVRLERDCFRKSYVEEWANTRRFFLHRDPKQIDRAERDPRHQMALVFRSYLGQSSNWAVSGDPQRKVDYQIWCGPAMGTFNEWVRGSLLEPPENRTVTTVAMNLLWGAAVITRINWLRLQRVDLPPEVCHVPPLSTEQIRHYLEE